MPLTIITPRERFIAFAALERSLARMTPHMTAPMEIPREALAAQLTHKRRRPRGLCLRAEGVGQVPDFGVE